MIKELISRPSLPAPKFTINKEITNFYDFKVEDFNIEGYEYGPSIGRVPIAI